jgi:hypothetical protein
MLAILHRPFRAKNLILLFLWRCPKLYRLHPVNEGFFNLFYGKKPP